MPFKAGHSTFRGRKHTEESKQRIRQKLLGRRHTPEARRKMSEARAQMPKERREAYRRLLSRAAKARGPNHNWYVDGNGAERAAERKRVYDSQELKAWRRAVYERDDYTCQKCGQRGGKLNAHHIKDWKNHPELRFDLDNGQTLCVKCHRGTPTFADRNQEPRPPKTHCSKGHPLTEDNVIRLPGKRLDRIQCRACQQEWQRRAYRKRTAHLNLRPQHGTETHCPQGHPYSGDNLILTLRGGRRCRACKNAESTRRHARQRAESPYAPTSPIENLGASRLHNAQKTHCPQGHPYEGVNLIITKRGTRRCRICVDAQNRAAGAKRPSRATGRPKGRKRTQCPQGHPYVEGNVSWQTRRVSGKEYTVAVCLECKRASACRSAAKAYAVRSATKMPPAGL